MPDRKDLDAMAEQLRAAGYSVKPPRPVREPGHKRVVRKIAADGTVKTYEYPPYQGKSR